ncbi:plasmid replication initiation protein RepA1 [Citrobacter freundii]|nr:plasmid replication initiation protein RepA1 [Citrobacter freundii]
MRSVYIHNPNPKFIAPAHHAHKLPSVLQGAIKNAQGGDLTGDMVFYVNLPPERRRRIYEARRKAINAAITGILYFVNIVSREVHASAEQLADQCGLSTVSAAGNKSITRLTRALVMMKGLGLVQYKRRFDRVSRKYFPAEIVVTDTFIELVGISPEAWQRAVEQKLNYFNAKNSKRLGKAITESDYARIARQERLEQVWNRRKTEREINAKKKAAERAERIAKEQGEEELHSLVKSQVSQEFRDGLHPGASLSDLRSIVEHRINYLKKIRREESRTH